MNESLKNNTDLISEYINKLVETLDMRRDLGCFDNILFYCLIWTFNTFLFYKKVLKPILNL